jgi:hypothetical protein
MEMCAKDICKGGLMDLLHGTLRTSYEKPLFCSYLANHLSLQYSSWRLITAHQVGCESQIVPKDTNIERSIHIHFLWNG